MSSGPRRSRHRGGPSNVAEERSAFAVPHLELTGGHSVWLPFRIGSDALDIWDTIYLADALGYADYMQARCIELAKRERVALMSAEGVSCAGERNPVRRQQKRPSAKRLAAVRRPA